jgi:methylmalonyl-CoA mutase cobalamin-binding subunit
VSEPTPGHSSLTREQILAALNALNRALAESGVMGEICLFGGTVMVLAFNARLGTKDVDAVFQPATAVRDLARQVGESVGLPSNWLNDGVKGY